VVFFEENLHVRIKAEELSHLEKVVKKNQDIFMSESHLVRCALIKFLRDYDNKGRRLTK
jgi:Arc/MetJ-type ribon-helix-helix transcriptional regulator